MGLHGRNSHPLDCQLRSQNQSQKKSEPPYEGGASEGNEEAKKARERLPIMPSPTTNQIGGSTPLVSYRGDAAIHCMVSVIDILGSIRKTEQHAENACVYKMSLQLPQYQCCRRQCSVRKAGSQGIQPAELFTTLQDVIVPEGPAVRCSTYRRTW